MSTQVSRLLPRARPLTVGLKALLLVGALLAVSATGSASPAGADLTRRPMGWQVGADETAAATPAAPGDSGYFAAMNSGRVMDVPGASLAPGTQLVQWAWNGGTNQEWIDVPFGNGVFAFFNARSGMALDVAGGSTAEGAGIVQSVWQGSVSQLWLPVPLSALVPGGSPYVYMLISVKSGKVVTVSGASPANGASLVQRNWAGGLNQLWYAFYIV